MAGGTPSLPELGTMIQVSDHLQRRLFINLPVSVPIWLTTFRGPGCWWWLRLWAGPPDPCWGSAGFLGSVPPVANHLSTFQFPKSCHCSLLSFPLYPCGFIPLKEILNYLFGGDSEHESVCHPYRDKAQAYLSFGIFPNLCPATRQNWSLSPLSGSPLTLITLSRPYLRLDKMLPERRDGALVIYLQSLPQCLAFGHSLTYQAFIECVLWTYKY